MKATILHFLLTVTLTTNKNTQVKVLGIAKDLRKKGKAF